MNSENKDFGKRGLGDESIEPKVHQRIGSVKKEIEVQSRRCYSMMDRVD